jgi:Phage endonuclease I
VALSQRAAGLKHGFRSGLEEAVAEQLREAGVNSKYESLVIEYVKPQRTSKYTPDFPLPNGIIVETKGRFMTEDRQKHLLVKAQHPDLDIRFVFSNPNQRISKTSATTYAMWATKHGFKFAAKLIPAAWVKEKRRK